MHRDGKKAIVGVVSFFVLFVCGIVKCEVFIWEDIGEDVLYITKKT